MSTTNYFTTNYRGRFIFPEKSKRNKGIENVNWAIILAGGSEDRMQGPIFNWLGYHCPKQFCTFVGTRSMLQHTWDRAKNIVGHENIVTIALSEDGEHFKNIDRKGMPGKLIYQPKNHGTATAIYLALAHILVKNPAANVIVLPSDQFIFPETQFTGLSRKALSMAASMPKKITLFGAKASWATRGCHWIVPKYDDNGELQLYQPELADPNPGLDLCLVAGFSEKPSGNEAHQLFRSKAFWNTSIFAANAQQLWQWLQIMLPDLFERLEYVHEIIRIFNHVKLANAYVNMAISNMYYQLGNYDFYRDVIQYTTKSCFALPMRDVEWNDWGTLERIDRTLQQHELQSHLKGIGFTPKISTGRRNETIRHIQK